MSRENSATLEETIRSASRSPLPEERQWLEGLLRAFFAQLEAGTIRAAEPREGGWRVNDWVREGILLAFRAGTLQSVSHAGQTFYEKSTFPVREFSIDDTVRIVPGGTSVRRGAHIASGVIIMPPSYINTGAFVGTGTMIDSHVLIGSCAQIGERVHISAGTQIGGVLEPPGAYPVIVEDDVMVGGNVGIFEGTIVGRGAVIAAGVQLTHGTPLYDSVAATVRYAAEGEPLAIPAGAVVVPGTRALTTAFGAAHGLGVATPIIIKYRDERTASRTRLEERLRTPADPSPAPARDVFPQSPGVLA